MAYELVYTSAPQGINRGSSGFCVVAYTNGLGPRLIAALEGFSAYKTLYPHYAENAWDNPISRQHYIFEANGERQHILSRICFNGVDYTGRSNKLASHLVLSRNEAERVPGGPAALLMREELFKNADWPIRPELYDKQRPIPSIPGHMAKCAAWESVTGDAGWGGYLAQSFLDNPQRNVYLVYRPELNRIIPELFDEAINLLPEDKRWLVTFNSYFVALPAGGNCAWRGVPTESGALLAARRSPTNIVIDLNNPGKLAATGKLIDCARTGISPEPESVPVPEPTNPVGRHSVRSTLTEPKPPNEETPEIPISEPPRQETVTAQRPISVVEPRKTAKWPIIAATAVLLAAVLTAGVCFAVGHVREQRAYQQALGQCQEQRQTLDMVEEDFGRLESDCKTLEAQIERLNELVATVEAVEQKIDDSPEIQMLFDDALGSGKLADNRYTPKTLKESCDSLNAELQDKLSSVKQKIRDLAATEERRKKHGVTDPKKKPEPEPQPEKKVEKSAPKTEPEKKVETPAPKPVEVKKKQLAKSDDPQTIWKDAEILYAGSAERRSVEVNVGDAEPKDIEIRLFPDNKGIHPGDGKTLTFGDQYGNNVSLEIAYDVNTGKLTITTPRQLPNYKRIVISVGGVEFPLFFKARFSKPIISKVDLTFPVSGQNVSLRIAQLRLPQKIFRGNREINNMKYALKCGDAEYPMQLGKDELQCTFDDKILSKCRKREAALKELKKQLEATPEKYIRKIRSGDLEKNKKLQSLVGDFNKQHDSLLRRANAVKKKFDIKKITSLREFHDGLPKDAKEKWGDDTEYKKWVEDYNKWNAMSKRLGGELIEKAPMKLLWRDRGNKTLNEELADIREKTESRITELRKEKYWLMISDAVGEKIDEIELDIK